MAREVQLTKGGFERLKSQLEEEYRRLSEATQILQELMDSSDDYDDSGLEDAKREKAQIESRITSLEDTLSRAVVIESLGGRDIVALGSRVFVQDIATGETSQFQVVDTAEASILEEPMKVSDVSPIGRAVLNKKEGDSVTVSAPVGEIRYRILSTSD